MNIDLIKPYIKNAKKHPKKQVEQIAKSIEEFGFNQPIVVDKDNVVIVGHGRLEAAKLLGLTDVPTTTVDLTEEQAKAYRLADSRRLKLRRFEDLHVRSESESVNPERYARVKYLDPMRILIVANKV